MKLHTLASETLREAYAEFRFLLWKINRRIRKSVTISTKQGIFTVLLADNVISKSLYCYGQYELDIISEAMGFLRSIQKCPPKGKGIIVDVGANNGIISIGALYTGELEKAIAIEPEPQNFLLLEKNVNQNGFKDKIICLPYAVSDQKGEVLLELSKVNFGDHRVHTGNDLVNSTSPTHGMHEARVVTIQSDQLDNLLKNLPEAFTKDISLLWVDVQGYEGYVFMGAKKLLSKGIPVVSEIWPYGMRRAGMSQEKFCEIAESIWSYYYVLRKGRYARYPISMLYTIFDELKYEDHGDYENVIFI